MNDGDTDLVPRHGPLRRLVRRGLGVVAAAGEVVVGLLLGDLASFLPSRGRSEPEAVPETAPPSPLQVVPGDPPVPESGRPVPRPAEGLGPYRGMDPPA